MLDPSIPLSVRPPQLMNLQDVFNAQRQHQQFETQQQMAQSELKTQGLQQQQAQMGLDSTQALNDAYKQPGIFTKGPNGTPTLDTTAISSYLAGKGQGHLVPGITKTALELNEAANKITESRSKLAAEEAEYAGTVGATAITKLPDGTSRVDPDRLAFGLSHAAQLYGADSPSAKALAALEADPTKADAIANALVQGSTKQRTTAASELTANARKESADTNAAEFKIKTPLIQAQTTEAQQKAALEQRQADATALSAAAKKGPDALAEALGQLPYGRAKLFEGETDPTKILQLGLTPAEQTTAANAAAGRTETNRHNLKEEQQGAQRVANEQAGLNIRRVEADPFGQFGLNPHPIGGGGASNGTGGAALHGEEYLKTLPPAMQDLVRGMATGRITAPTAQSRTPIAQAQRAALLQYDPEFSEQRAQVRKAFTTGKDGSNIGALNTATVHLDQLAEAAAAMKNGTFRPGNALYNAVSTMFGGNAPTNFEGVKAAVSGEMATALKGNATDEEIKTIKATIDRSSSPEQFQGAVQEGLKILGAKLNTYQERYRGVNPADTVWSPVLPSAKAVYEKHGINPTAGPAANVKSNAPAVQLPPEAKSQLKEGMHTTFQNGQVWTLQGGQPVQVQQAGK